jgi:hypothetical protein
MINFKVFFPFHNHWEPSQNYFFIWPASNKQSKTTQKELHPEVHWIKINFYHHVVKTKIFIRLSAALSSASKSPFWIFSLFMAHNMQIASIYINTCMSLLFSVIKTHSNDLPPKKMRRILMVPLFSTQKMPIKIPYRKNIYIFSDFYRHTATSWKPQRNFLVAYWKAICS